MCGCRCIGFLLFAQLAALAFYEWEWSCWVARLLGNILQRESLKGQSESIMPISIYDYFLYIDSVAGPTKGY